MKHCNHCNTTKSKSDFYSNKNKKDGLHCFCKTCSRSLKNEWAKENKDKVKSYDTQWQVANKDKKAIHYKTWQQNNKPDVNTYNSYRRAAKLKATPSWANEERIKYFYTLAKFFTDLSGGYVKHHVDHIVPLRGKNVCGLHVENNLQVLMTQDNLKKRNLHEI